MKGAGSGDAGAGGRGGKGAGGGDAGARGADATGAAGGTEVGGAGIRSCSGVGPASAGRTLSFGEEPVAPLVMGRPTGRSAASRLPSVASCSPPGGNSGCLRGLNQPPPPLPPEVPLSADVVVGASMVCLASNIFQSVRALPRSECARVPPLTACCSPFGPRPMRPHSTRTTAPYGQVRPECDIGRSALTAASHRGRTPPCVTGNTGFRSPHPVRLHCPALAANAGYAPRRGQEPESTIPAAAARTTPARPHRE